MVEWRSGKADKKHVHQSFHPFHTGRHVGGRIIVDYVDAHEFVDNVEILAVDDFVYEATIKDLVLLRYSFLLGRD